MKINKDALAKSQGKMKFLVSEYWQGLPPTTTYEQQAEAVARALDSVEYIERAVGRGDVVMAHKEKSRTGTTQLLAVDRLEDLNNYIKGNEAHARLPPSNRTVLPLVDWDEGVRTLEMMITRAEVRARYEREGQPQPSQDLLGQEAEALFAARLNQNE